MRRYGLLIALTLLFSLSSCGSPVNPTVEVPPTPLPSVEIVVESIAPEPVAAQPWTDEETTVLAKMLWGEARGVRSITEQAACVWCALNRVDAGYGPLITVVTAPYQFVGYREDHPVDDTLKALCEDVLSRWYAEKAGGTEAGRVLPADYLWFSGDGKNNHFRNSYEGGNTWDWSLETPYES